MHLKCQTSFTGYVPKGKAKFEEFALLREVLKKIQVSYDLMSCVLVMVTDVGDSVLPPSLGNNCSPLLNLSDPISNLVREYDFPVLIRCRKTFDTFFCCVCLPAVGACPTLFLM
jgi:hypothetical protein